MRVLLISQTCQSLREGQPKAMELGRLPGIELTVLVPDRFKMYGQYRHPQPPADDAPYQYAIGKVRWPWAGPAQHYLMHYRRLGRLIRQIKPDVIDLWEEPWALVSAQTVALRNRICQQVPIVSETEQNTDKHLPPPFESIRSYVLRNAQFVVGRNGEAIDIVRRRGYGGAAAVVPNAVDAELFRPMDREACRKVFGVRGTVAAYIGRLVTEKGIDDILAAMKKLPADVHLLIAGDGPRGDDLQAAARGVLAGRITLLGKLPLDRLPEVMNAADVLLLPSRTTPRWKEQFGRVIIEAHVCGTPVIGSDSGAIPDVVGPGGLVVPEANPAALAGAILQIHADPTTARRMGELGRERALRLFTWKAVAQRMATIYERATMRSESSSAPAPRQPHALTGPTDPYDTLAGT